MKHSVLRSVFSLLLLAALVVPLVPVVQAQGGLLDSIEGVVFQGDKVPGEAMTPKHGDKFVIGLSLEGVDHPFMQSIIKDVTDSAQEYGWDLLVTDGGGDPEKQVAGIEDMVAKGIDLLMVQAAKAAPLKPILEKIHGEGIPFMFVGKPIKGTDAFTIVAPDNYYIGQQIGPWIVEQLTAKNGAAKGNIVIVEGIPGDETSIDRIGGAMDVLKDYPDIKVVAQQPAEYRQPQAVTVVSNILQAHPEQIDGIFSANGDMALGAAVAARDADRLGEFWIIGIDCSPEEMSGIRAGDETACWAYKPSGKEASKVVKAYLDGEGSYPVVVSPTYRVDKANVETAKPAWGSVAWQQEAAAGGGILDSIEGVVFQGDKVPGEAMTPKHGDKFTIGLSLEGVDHPFMQSIIKDVTAASEENGWNLLVTDGGGDPEKQVAGIEDMVAKGIDLLMVQAAKAAPLKPILEKIHGEGIPFMFVGKPIKGTDAFTIVAPDNYYIGQQIGPWIVEQLTAKNGAAKGNIVIVEGIPGDETSIDRIGGAMDVLKDYPDIKVVAQQPAEYRQPQAVTVVSNILQAHPEQIDGIFSANGDMALGAAVAARDADRLGEFWIIGIDCSPEEMSGIRAGDETACWAYKPSGKEASLVVKAYLAGEGSYPVVVSPTYRVDKDNIETAKPAWGSVEWNP